MRTVLEAARDATTAPHAAATSSWLERHATAVALALFAANVALVLPRIGAQSIWFDEAVTLSNAQQPFDLVRYLKADATPPLYPLLVHLWMLLFGATIESARALSVLASAASAVLLFQLGRRFLDARSGLIAALLLSTSRVQIFFAHEARPYALVVLLCIASFYVLFALLESVTRPRVLLLAVLDATLLYAHYVSLFAFVAQGLAALLLLRQKPRAVVAVAASQALAVLLVLPLALYVAMTIWPLPMAGWLAPPTWRSLPIELGKLAGWDVMIALELVLILGGIAWILRREAAAPRTTGFDPVRARVLALWAFAPVVASFATSFAEPTLLARYLLYVTPGLFLLVGYVASRLPVATATRGGLVAALCALSLVHALEVPIVRPDWRAGAARLHAEIHDGALAIVVPAHQMLPLAYHFSLPAFRAGERIPELLAGEGVVGVPRLDDVVQFAGSGRDLLVLFPDWTSDAGSLSSALAAAGCGETSRENLHGLVLLRFARRDQSRTAS